jgi:hypothetical protein
VSTGARSLATIAAVLLLAVVPPSCTVREPQPSTYFARTIAPILTNSCARGPTGAGCHVADAKGNAFGNLDASTFAGIDRRRDLFAAYGPYGQPTLLLKVTPPSQLDLVAFDGQPTPVTTDVRHAGGPILDPTGAAYQTLRRWIEAGGSEDDTGPPPAPQPAGGCASQVPSAPGFDPTRDPARPDFAVFETEAMPVLVANCAAASCHGSPFNSLRLLCGDTPEQLRWNYFVASGYLATNAPDGELLRRALASGDGGSFHEGGPVFSSTSDAGYRALLDWATAHGPPDAGVATPGFAFFAHRVQPALARKGCMMLHCHSASMFHDYRLSGGSAGSFSLASTRRNYALSLAQLALESDDPNASRLVKKNLYRPEVFAGGGGLAHRGGPLFEDFGGQPASATLCDQHRPPYDYDQGTLDAIPAYCVVREWLRRERAARPLAPLSAIVYVRRPVGAAPDRMQDFDVYAPGAELHVVQATLGADGSIALGTDVVANAGCGLDPATADVRRPSVSWDGSRIAFAARSSATEPLAIYEMNADGTACAKNAGIAAHPATGNGLLEHDFDPAYSPPEADGSVHLVFASTRGNAPTGALDYSGPQRTPADPTKPNANLFAYEADPVHAGQMRVRQLTYLLDMERAPAFMADGRVVFTVEKREPGFYQLALRRMNIDGGDYHPLYGQRSSIGFHEVSQVVQLSDKDFAAVFAEAGVPHHGGALGIVNRSIGVDFHSADPADYPVDPGVIDPSAPSSPEPAFFLHSLRFPDPTATGALHGSTSGLYASPSPLPDGRVLVSFGAASDSASFDGDYDLYALDPTSGARTKLLGIAGVAEVDAVAVYGRPPRGVYRSAPGEPNAYALDERQDTADVVMHDATILASLMFQNTPTGRVREQLPGFEVWEELPPTPDVTTFAQGGNFVTSDAFGQVYVRRRQIGTVPILSDGSAHWRVPGGVPFVLHLLDSPESIARGIPRWQREEGMLSPGESEDEALRPDLFDGFCGQCHGPTSGRPVDATMRADVLVSASQTLAATTPPVLLVAAPSQRGPAMGPPTDP